MTVILLQAIYLVKDESEQDWSNPTEVAGDNHWICEPKPAKNSHNFPRVISTDILSEYSDSLSVILSEFAIGLTSILTFYLAYFRVHVRSE